MPTFRLQLVTPVETLFDGAVDSVRLKTDLGRMEVLPNHATLVGTILYSKVYSRHLGVEEKYIIRHGSVQVNKQGDVTILALEAHKESEMTVKTMEEYLHFLAEQLDDPHAFNDYQKQFLQDQREALEHAIADVE
ncbi:TPA: hypothetical protein DEB00_00335 [Candidatus Uhrbacteria bacterium]|nr:hypothetical protein [Candidatus Uhrbacteria bacterium]